MIVVNLGSVRSFDSGLCPEYKECHGILFFLVVSLIEEKMYLYNSFQPMLIWLIFSVSPWLDPDLMFVLFTLLV